MNDELRKHRLSSLRRSEIWITPCKHSAARGKKNILPPELRRSSTLQVVSGVCLQPRVAPAAYLGLSIFNAYGVKNLKTKSRRDKILVENISASSSRPVRDGICNENIAYLTARRRDFNPFSTNILFLRNKTIMN